MDTKRQIVLAGVVFLLGILFMWLASGYVLLDPMVFWEDSSRGELLRLMALLAGVGGIAVGQIIFLKP